MYQDKSKAKKIQDSIGLLNIEGYDWESGLMDEEE